MTRKTFAPRPERPAWETPAAEEIRVSAEATAYMGTWKDEDWA
ncbi:MAG TPA: pyrroloquinoline quinone precursor peptide PqqA [Streptosporangiaceae bacterium]|jgi:coenzyme PQQ precursor peptide PqqA|nr:pyrroloquinoline quinone precursor peptide PqqA [Streptosporangiaceae bacterium]